MRCQDLFPPVDAADIPPGLAVRAGGPADAAALVALDRVCFGRRAWTARAWHEAVAEPGWTVRIAEIGELPVAASVLVLAPAEAMVASLAVHPDLRRRGLGTLLLREAVARGRDSCAGWIALEVDADNAAAIALYRREGFGVSRRFREDGRARLGMRRRLGGRHG